MKKLLISAGGKGSRIEETRRQLACTTKHLLPTTDNQTLLGEIIENTKTDFNTIEIYSAPYNHNEISTMTVKNGYGHFTDVIVDVDMTGPLGPVARELSKTNERTYGCAGDLWAIFSWKKFIEFHESHKFPVSILLGKSLATKDGASFETEKNKITSWRRGMTSDSDYINIGCYIIDPVPTVLDYFKLATYHKEDSFFSYLIEHNLLAGLCLKEKAFNINSDESYSALIQHLQQTNTL